MSNVRGGVKSLGHEEARGKGTLASGVTGLDGENFPTTPGFMVKRGKIHCDWQEANPSMRFNSLGAKSLPIEREVVIGRERVAR